MNSQHPAYRHDSLAPPRTSPEPFYDRFNFLGDFSRSEPCCASTPQGWTLYSIQIVHYWSTSEISAKIDALSEIRPHFVWDRMMFAHSA